MLVAHQPLEAGNPNAFEKFANVPLSARLRSVCGQ